MALIDIDLESLLPPSLLGLLDNAEALVEAVLDDVATSALLKWRQLASTNLFTSKRDYLDSIQDIEVLKGERVIVLTGFLANAIEQGLESYDLKTVLLRRGARTSKAGYRYRPIPFRHATPGARTGQAGRPMGERYGPVHEASLATPGALDHGAAAALGKAVHKEAKKLKPGQRLPVGVGGAKKLASWHATDLYAGMAKRTQKAAGGAAQTSGYMTFRMVSENPAVMVAGEKWLHPGIQARNFAEQVTEHTSRLVIPAFTKAVENALGGS